MSKHRGWLLFGGLVLLLAVSIVICEWLEWPFLRGPLQKTLSRTLGREVSLGPDFGVRFLGSIRLHDDAVVIGTPEGAPTLQDDSGKARDFLRATDARLVLPYSTVIALARSRHDKPLRVRVLEVKELDLALVRTSDSKANWTFGQADKEAGAAVAVPQFDRLVVGGGTVRVQDAVAQLKLEGSVRTTEGSTMPSEPGQPPAAHPTAPGKASAPDKEKGSSDRAGPADKTNEQAEMATPEKAGSPSPAAANAGLEIKATGQYRETPFSAELHTSGLLPLAATGESAPPVPVRVDLKYGEIQLKLDGRAHDVLHLAGVDGDFGISGPSLAAVGDLTGATLPTTAAFDMKGAIHKQGAVWSGAVRSLSVGSSRLSGEFEYDSGPDVPHFSGTLAGARLALSDLAPALGAAPSAKEQEARQNETKRKEARNKQEKTKETGERILPQREFNIPTLGAMEANVEVKLDTADLGTSQLEVLKPLTGRVVLHEKVLTLKDLVAHTSGGELRGTLSIDADKPTPVWNADLTWNGIRLERFVKARNPLNTTGKDVRNGKGAPYVKGQLGGRAKLQGAGRSTAAMLGSLDGSSELWVKDGAISHLLLELMGLDAAQALGVAVSGDSDLPMRCAVAHLKVKDGLIQPEVAVIDTTDTTVLVTGELSLVNERLAIVLTAKPKDFSLVSLRSPVLIEGSFAHPQVSINATSVGLKLAGAAVLAAAVAPVAGLLALFDMGETEKQVCSNALQGMQAAPPGVKRKAKGNGK